MKQTRLKSMPRARANQGNLAIWYELEALRLASEAQEKALTPEEYEKKKQAGIERAKALHRQEMKAEAKARAAKRREEAKPAEETAAKAWETYKQAKRAKQKAKAGKWKAYAIRKAIEAIDQGKGEALPTHLKRAAEAETPGPRIAGEAVYLVYIYQNGKIVDISERRTMKQAENVKRGREQKPGTAAEIMKLSREAEEIAEAETEAIKLTRESAERARRKHHRLAEQARAEAAAKWNEYRARGGNHPLPKGYEEGKEGQ